jgi:hypothetical protein
MSAARGSVISFDAKECIFRNTFVNESLLYAKVIPLDAITAFLKLI